MFPKTRLLGEKYQLFLVLTTLIFAQGCAHSPFMKEWDWTVNPDLSNINSDFKRDNARMKKTMEAIHKRHPKWRNLTAKDVVFVEIYDEKGRPKNYQIER